MKGSNEINSSTHVAGEIAENPSIKPSTTTIRFEIQVWDSIRMKLHCLGTAGYHPSESRHTSCYAIPDLQLALDAGSGFFRISPFVQSDTLDILLSHAHLDHVFGLTFLLDIMATTSLRHVRIYGEAEKLDAIQTHLFHPLIFPVAPTFQWIPLETLGESFELKDCSIQWFRMEHPGGSVGYRIQTQTTSIAYITDTTSYSDSSYWQKIQGVDWLLHECNFPDSYRDLAIKTGHSWTSSVLESAQKSKIKRLILSHMNPLSIEEDPIGLAQATSQNLRRTPETIIIAKDHLAIDLQSL